MTSRGTQFYNKNMALFLLTEEPLFPPPEFAEEDGLLAIGGDLSLERLLKAYEMGIFPWYSEGSPILWWSPDPRPVLLPHELKLSRSLRQVIKKGIFRLTMDSSFEEVITSCRQVHTEKSGGTWLTDEMVEAYINLHHEGYAHSVETWVEDRLVGGLYGVSLGAAFFGESMFTRVSNASKVAFVGLVFQLKRWNFHFIDCQVKTEHMLRFGAKEVKRAQFLRMLRKALRAPTRRGRWSLDTDLCSLSIFRTPEPLNR